MRQAAQDAVADRFTGVVEDLTKRRVVAFMSQAHVNPDIAIEVFLLDSELQADDTPEPDRRGEDVGG